MSDARIVFGLDLGGTQIKGLAVSADGSVLAEESQPTTDAGDAAWRANVEAVFARLRKRYPAGSRVGLCAPGIADRAAHAIALMPGRLRGLEHLAWEDVFGLPTVVLNDAHAALLGEHWQGAARGIENVFMLTLGTGVGGAAMVDGRLLRGHVGRAGHLGHISLNPDGPPDIVGTPGSLEDAVGECTIAARTENRFRGSRELVAAATAGDPLARDAWHRSLRALAAALTGLINILDPHTIVIGGGLAAAGDALFTPLRAELERMEWRIGGHRVPIVPAKLGVRAGAFGAAYCALQAAPSS